MRKHGELSFFLDKVEVGNVSIYCSGNAGGELVHHLIINHLSSHVNRLRELFSAHLAFVGRLCGGVAKMVFHLRQHFVLVPAG